MANAMYAYRNISIRIPARPDIAYTVRMNDLADDLRAWRSALKWSQARAAEALGVPPRTYQGWEGDRRPDHPSVVRLAMEAATPQDGLADRGA